MLIKVLLVTGSLLIGILGLIHLVYTYRTDKFEPRDAALGQRLREVAPVLTSQTTMWRAWVGFNASHSLGALLFAAIYGFLALFETEFLLSSPYLVGVSMVTLISYLLLARAYWFSAPYTGISLSTLMFAVAYGLALFQ